MIEPLDTETLLAWGSFARSRLDGTSAGDVGPVQIFQQYLIAVCAALAASPQHIEWLAWGSAWLDRIEARRSGHFDLTDFGRFLAVGNEALGTALKQSKTRTKVMGRPAQSSLGHRVAKLMAHGMQEEQASHAVAAYSGATPAKVRKSLLWVRREVEKVEARTAAKLKKSKPPQPRRRKSR